MFTDKDHKTLGIFDMRWSEEIIFGGITQIKTIMKNDNYNLSHLKEKYIDYVQWFRSSTMISTKAANLLKDTHHLVCPRHNVLTIEIL